MESKQFRIGNYLQDREGNLCQVIELGRDSVYAPVIGKAITKLPNLPIKITEEWLLKFGFTHIHDDLYKLEIVSSDATFIFVNLNHYSKDIGISINNQRMYLSKKYVHELQNLYHSFCGEELKLK